MDPNKAFNSGGLQRGYSPTPGLQVTSNPTNMDVNSVTYGGNTLGGTTNIPSGPSAADLADAKQQANIMGQITSGRQNIGTTATESAQSGYNTQQANIMDFINSAQNTQTGIDQSRKNTALSKVQGDNDIMSMINRGINSGGVMLANRNAVNSGATGQIARAYGELGNREAQGLNNQFELENQGIDQEQTSLYNSFDEQERKTNEFKIATADSIATQARQDLAMLNEQAIGADLGTQFEINQEKQRIRQGAMAKLGELDSILSSERAKFQPVNRNAAMGAARGMAAEGQSTPQQFDVNTSAAPISGGQSLAGANVPTYSNAYLKRREV
jgi:hypothetical protein